MYVSFSSKVFIVAVSSMALFIWGINIVASLFAAADYTSALIKQQGENAPSQGYDDED
jgi:hypothetical protein